jgi:hypothetical protein
VAKRNSPGCGCCSSNPCALTWPATLTCKFSVAQSKSAGYFANTIPGHEFDPSYVEPPYTLTYGARPAAIPSPLLVTYFINTGANAPPFFVTVPASAWWSPPIAVNLFGSPTNCYFYLWFKGCSAVVMVVDESYAQNPTTGSLVPSGAGNLEKTYIVTRAGSLGGPTFQMSAGPFPPVVIEGTHGADDVVPDVQGGAGYPTDGHTGTW